MPRTQGQRLRKAEKEELAERALTMSCKGRTITAISEELDISWTTASKLIDYALEKRDIDEDAERERSLAHHRAIIDYCWDKLEDDKLMAHAQNRPAYIARIQVSQAEIDRLNNVTPPVKVQQDINHTYRDMTTGGELEEMFEKIDEYRLAAGADEGDGETDTEVAIHSEGSHT